MIDSPTTWIVVPLLGGLIGWATNRLAVKMIFRPIRPVRVLGFRVQGLIGRRQEELAASIGRVVGDHLVQHDDLMRSLESVDLSEVVGSALDRGLDPKIEQMRELPIVGGFLTDERVVDLKRAVTNGILENREALFKQLEAAVERGLDVEDLVRRKVAGFSVERVERIVLDVASRELRSIEVLGGVLGCLIGLAQVLVIGLL